MFKFLLRLLPERLRRLPSYDGTSEPILFLESRGYFLRTDFTWRLPSRCHRPTRLERHALHFLADEYDYGLLGYKGPIGNPSNETPRYRKGRGNPPPPPPLSSKPPASGPPPPKRY